MFMFMFCKESLVVYLGASKFVQLCVLYLHVLHICRVLCRLYWFPMKAGQSAGYVSMLLCPGGAFYVPFNSMLIALYLMQLYWFYFIVKLLIKVGSFVGTLKRLSFLVHFK